VILRHWVKTSQAVLKFPAMPNNELYLVVLPIIHLTQTFGLTEQVLTLLPGREMATEFFRDEVHDYISTFDARANQYLIGGHVQRYEAQIVDVGSNRVVVKVVQIVA
jgi:hypothetical protein